MGVRRVVIRGFGSGVVAGLVLVALMYLAKLLIGTTPLPQLLQQPILAVMPGFVFGFLIDTLQHAGKVVEEAGIIVGMIVGLGVLGGAWGWAMKVWARPPQALLFAAAGWAIVVFALLPISGDGFLGLGRAFRRVWRGAASGWRSRDWGTGRGRSRAAPLVAADADRNRGIERRWARL